MHIAALAGASLTKRPLSMLEVGRPFHKLDDGINN